METICEKVKKNLKILLKNEKNSSILVALSGGKDSISLLNILLELKSEFSLKIFAAYINHNLRGKESQIEENFVTGYAEKLGLQFFKHAVDPDFWKTLKRESIEMAARKVRYNFFRKIAGEKEVGFIATAHNFNDKVETFFLQVLRAGGIETLSSIPFKNGNIIRPLINISRAEIEEYVKSKNLPFIEDSTNKQNIYKRNIIRNKIISVLPEIQPNYEKSLSKFFEFIDSEKKLLGLITVKFFNKICIYHSTEFICIDKIKFFKFPLALRKNIIKQILKKLDFPAKPDQILFKEITLAKEKIIYKKNNFYASGSGNKFWFVNLKSLKEFKKEIKINKVPFEYSDADLKIEIEKSNLDPKNNFVFSTNDFPLNLRPLKESDTIITAIGIKITKILKNMKVPSVLFKEVCVLETTKGGIIGFVLKNVFRISKEFYVKNKFVNSFVLNVKTIKLSGVIRRD